MSDRFDRLGRFWDFYKCREYDHQKVGWDGLPADRFESINSLAVQDGATGLVSVDLKVRQKRPTAPRRLNKMVVDRFTGLLFGYKRKPRVRVEDDPVTDDFLQAVFKRSRFWNAIRICRTHGGSMGSSLLLISLKEGRFFFQAISPRLVAEIAWKDDEKQVPEGVLIQYLFRRESPDGGSSLWVYRRIVDEELDVEYEPVELEPGGEVPPMQPASVVRHNLGRFPGVWIRNFPSDDESGPDGAPDAEGAYQIFETIDRISSQSNHSLLYNQDPTVVLARDTKLELANVPVRKGSENALTVGIGGSAQYMEMTGGAVSIAVDFRKDLQQGALDLVQCVVVDPEKVSATAQSGRAIELLYSPMFDKADVYREQYGESIEQAAQIVILFGRLYESGSSYEVPIREVVWDLPSKTTEISTGDDPEQTIRVQEPRRVGGGSSVSVEWGDYFPETPSDVQEKIGVLAAARMARGLDEETFVRRVAKALSIEDEDGLIQRLQEESPTQDSAEEFGIKDPGEEFQVGYPLDVPVDSTVSTTGSAAIAKTDSVKQVALNGNQIDSAIRIVSLVVLRELPPESAEIMLSSFFGLSMSEARAIVGPAVNFQVPSAIVSPHGPSEMGDRKTFGQNQGGGSGSDL